MNTNLKNTTGLEYGILSIVLAFTSNLFITKINYPALTFAISLIVFAILLYITYFRWIRLKLGNIFFVFFCILNLIVVVNGGASYDDALDYWTKNDDASYAPVLFASLSPLINLFASIMFLILVFKNANKLKSEKQ